MLNPLSEVFHTTARFAGGSSPGQPSRTTCRCTPTEGLFHEMHFKQLDRWEWQVVHVKPNQSATEPCEPYITKYFYAQSRMLPATRRTISTLTTVDMQYSRTKKRWLSALEKLAAMGFPATPAIASIYRQDCISTLILIFLKHQALCIKGMNCQK